MPNNNNWMTPKSEMFLKWEALTQKRARQLRAERPDLSDDAVVEMIVTDPAIAALGAAVEQEFRRHLTEQIMDSCCFIYANGAKLVEDEELLHMSDRELAAWAQQNGVMVAQLKAHLAERFPPTKGKA
jgi:hypothetical protein